MPDPTSRRARGLAEAALLAALAAGCDPGGSAAHDHAHEDHAAHEEHAEAHVHTAPHGGTLVELEHEALNLELLVDPSAGTLTAWVLDGHCENPVRVTQEAIEVTAVLGGTATAIRLEAVANALTGETKGDTSEFRGAHDGLRGAGEFDGTLRSLQVGPRAFTSVKFRYARSPQ